MVTGHGLFKRHIGHWNDVTDFSCALCGEAEEDSWHLWEFGPESFEERAILQNFIKQGMPYDIALIRFFRLDKMRSLVASNEALLQPD